jgi:signal transduction histidine kinase
MDDLGAQLVLPLCSESQLVGFWALTDRSLREAFSTHEIELLHGIARLMALTVENSKNFARIRARDRLAMVGEMSAGLAHEIRNPLATIRGAVALLDTAEPAEAADIRRLMVEEISRLDRLVDTFLNYARPSLDQAPIGDLAGFVRSCAADVQHTQVGTAVDLTVTLEPNLPSIRANPDHLERVVQNLLKNAYEALEGRSHGRIALCVRRLPNETERGAAVEIAVEDNGPGMDAATLQRAFIPFFTTKPTGTGLGLPLCERLVRAQGGELHVHSAPGEGTQVRIRLPLKPDASREAA